MAGELTDPAVMRARAGQHARSASAMAAAAEEWFAVCWFYSAYHLVRARMSEDPVFLDPSGLSQVDARLCMADQQTTRHQGRRGGGRCELGINDIVRLLYRPIAPSYHKLHQASIAVRYGHGLKATADDLRPHHKKIVGWFEDATGERCS